MFSLIVLTDSEGGIAAADGSIPMQHRSDMKIFRNKTRGNVVIMGRRTMESLPGHYLKDRLNVVLTRHAIDTPAETLVFGSIEDCVVHFTATKAHGGQRRKYKKELFVIGGAEIYRQFLERRLVSRIYWTKYGQNLLLPIRIPIQFENFVEVHVRDLVQGQYTYCELQYKNSEEEALIDLMRAVYSKEERINRTGTPSKSLFAPPQLEFDIGNSFPLLTSRRQHLKGIFEELMFFLRGQTDTQILRDRGVHVWDDNTSRQFLDSRGLQHYPEWDMGSSYSFQFRHFGAEYGTCRDNYDGQGFDQLAYVIDKLTKDPTNRRMNINLWNPAAMDGMSLPPCLYCYQFYVEGDRLDVKLTQRSSDIFLAGGWNIASGALLVYMLARVCGLQPGRVIWSPGDVHIYRNQYRAFEEFMVRSANAPFPKLYMRSSAPSVGDDITDFCYADIRLTNYAPQGRLNIPMNA